MRSQPEMIYSMVLESAHQFEFNGLEARLSQVFTQNTGLHWSNLP